MRLQLHLRCAVLLAALGTLAGCGLLPGRFADQGIRTIALVETPELEQVENHPGFPSEQRKQQLDYLVGKAFAWIIGKQEPPKGERGEELYQAIEPFHPRLNAALLDRVEARLTRLGYTVIRVPPGTRNDPTSTDSFDAVLDIAVVRAGYGPQGEERPTYPFVYVAESLIDANGNRLLDRLMCSGLPGTDITPADLTISTRIEHYALKDQNETLERPRRVLEAFYDGVATLADYVTRDFKSL